MDIGIVGLGKMGGNMARRWARGGHRVVGFARSAETLGALQREGLTPAASLEALVAALRPPRAIWLMLPAGVTTEETVNRLAGLLAPGDTLIDGGNTFYKDDQRRAAALASRRIDYLDQGTSGGIWGLEKGYCLMIGGAPPTGGPLKPAVVTPAPAAARRLGPRRPGRARHIPEMVPYTIP